MMGRGVMVFVGSLLLVVLSFSGAYAAKCKDVTGDWNLSVQGVKALVTGQSHQFLSKQGTFQITDQQGCAFYGTGDDQEPLVGIIQGNTLVIRSAAGSELEGTLVSNSSGQVTGMRFIFTKSDSKNITAAKGTATRH